MHQAAGSSEPSELLHQLKLLLLSPARHKGQTAAAVGTRQRCQQAGGTARAVTRDGGQAGRGGNMRLLGKIESDQARHVAVVKPLAGQARSDTGDGRVL